MDKITGRDGRNPKPAVLYLAFLPRFIHANDPVLSKSMFLATTQFVIGILWLMLLSRAWSN